MRNKLDDDSFMKKIKSSLKNMSKIDDNFCKKGSTKDGLSVLNKSIYVRGTEKGDIFNISK